MLVRGWKNPDAVAATNEFLRKPPPRQAAVRNLMSQLISTDPLARRSASDVARRVSAREPDCLRGYADLLIDVAMEIPLEEWQASSHAALAAAYSAATHAQRMRLVVLLRALVEDERNAVRAIALEAFAIVAAAEATLRDEVLVHLEHARRAGTPAARSRARRMLPLLLASNKRADRTLPPVH